MPHLVRTAALCASLLAAAPAAAQWDGLYAGGTGTITPGSVIDGFDDSNALMGGMFGAQLGYRFQLGPAVAGVEADYLFGETAYTSPDRKISIDQIGTIRANLGMPIGPLLTYATAGVAFARANVEDNSGPTSLLDENSHFGLTVGGGAELLVTSNLSVRGEYQFMQLGTESYDVSTPEYDLDYSVHSIRAGINFRF